MIRVGQNRRLIMASKELYSSWIVFSHLVAMKVVRDDFAMCIRCCSEAKILQATMQREAVEGSPFDIVTMTIL